MPISCQKLTLKMNEDDRKTRHWLKKTPTVLRWLSILLVAKFFVNTKYEQKNECNCMPNFDEISYRLAGIWRSGFCEKEWVLSAKIPKSSLQLPPSFIAIFLNGFEKRHLLSGFWAIFLHDNLAWHIAIFRGISDFPSHNSSWPYFKVGRYKTWFNN